MSKNLLLALLFISQMAGAQNWLTDFEKAKEEAKLSNKSIVMVFSGSDWCAPCIKLDKDIWQSPEFKAYAEDNFVMLRLDFPRRKANALPPKQTEANKALADKYNPNGYFPFVVVFNSALNKRGETGYKKMSPQEYINHLSAFLKWD